MSKLNKENKIKAFLFVFLFVALSPLSSISASTSHTITATLSFPEIVSDQDDFDDYLGAIVIDTEDNLHVVWTENYDFDHIDIKYRQKYANNGSWSDIFNLSISGYNVRATLLKMKMDSQGIVHLVWKERNYTSGTDFQKFRYYSDEGWSEIFTLTELNITSEYFDFVPISENELFFVYDSKYNTSTHELFYRTYNWVTQSFSSEYQLTNSSQDFHYPSIVADSQGTIHVAWTDVYDSTNHEIFYQRFNGSWYPNNPMIISEIGTLYAAGVKIFADTTGGIHFLYTKTNLPYRSYHYRILLLETLGPDILLQSGNDISYSYNLAINSVNTAHLIWTDILSSFPPKLQINFQQYTITDSWSNIIQYETTCFNGGTPINAFDSNGKMHIIWSGYVDNDWSIYYLNCTIQIPTEEAALLFPIIFAIAFLTVISIKRKKTD